MARLTPQRFKASYYEGVEKAINQFFLEEIFKPLVKVIKEENIEVQNSVDILGDAIKSGTIRFKDGVFTGDFNSKISREIKALGAKFSSGKQGWVLKGAPPASVSLATAAWEDKTKKVCARMLSTLDGINVEEALKKAKIRKELGLSLDKMDTDWLKTVESIGIKQKLTPAQVEVLKREWGDNLELYIKDFTEKNIIKLRSSVLPHAITGGRASTIAKDIQDVYGTSKAKAKFLARQETSLLMSKLKEKRYADAGITQYKWSTSHDERVRSRHTDLDGKIFSFDSPPITGVHGETNNPGEDFGCRCVAIPIL